MEKTVQESKTKILQIFKSMKKKQIIRLAILGTAVLAITIFLWIFINYKPYTVLYTSMEPADAGEVLDLLEQMGIDSKAQGADTVLVRSDQVDKVRMELAAKGYPESGYNYDIFKSASGLGTTDMEKKVYLQFQLQENLRQTIKKMEKVEDAVVNINLAEDSTFVLSNNSKDASAAVMLTLKQGKAISQDEVRSIAELVSKSISGLKIENVRIIDSKMKLYSLEEADTTQNVGSQLELQQTVHDKLQKQVANMLAPIFGEDGVLVEVAVTLNFDNQVTESVTFSPPVEGETGGLVVSMKQLHEIVANSGGASGVTGTTGNTDTYPTITPSPDATYQKVSTEANYELNQTKTQIESAKGKIENLSVSVILDSSKNSSNYTEKVKNLVSTAVGVKTDNITVEMLPFKQMEQNGSDATAVSAQAQMLKSAQTASLIRLIIIAVSGLLGLVLLLMAIKTILITPKDKVVKVKLSRSERKELKKEQKLIKKGKVPQEARTIDVVVSDQTEMQGGSLDDFEFGTKEDENLDKLEKFIDKSPEAVAQLLRSWLSD